MRYAFILALLGLASGCATAVPSVPSPSKDFYHSATNLFQGGHSYLLQDDIRETHMKEFSTRHPRWTEQDKINYLLETIQDSGIKFVRNGETYSSLQASQWLRWKMGHRQYRRDPIDSAAEFVERVCERSNKTGVPYEVVLRNGRRESAQQAIGRELKNLEKALSVRSV